MKKKPNNTKKSNRKDVSIFVENREKNMSLGDHLEELRSIIFKMFILILIIFVIALFFSDEIYQIFTMPYKKVLGEKAIFYQIKLTAPFMIYLKTSFLAAVLVGFPFLLYFLWEFVSPALDPNTDKFGKWIILSSSLLFWLGVAFCWYGAFQNLLEVFLIKFRPPDIDTSLAIDEYYNVFFNIHLIFGISFQMPIVIVLLNKMGIIDEKFLLRKWREAIVILSIAASVLSPGGDIFSMFILFIPLIVLFLASILIIKITGNTNNV